MTGHEAATRHPVDLTPAFCEAATAMSQWVGLADRVRFREGDATDLPFGDGSFDAAMTIHVAMNIAAKDRLYREALRVVRPGGRFVAYDDLQGEGGDVLDPVPWAGEPSISHLVTPDGMRRVLAVRDSSERGPRVVRGDGGAVRGVGSAAGLVSHLPG